MAAKTRLMIENHPKPGSWIINEHTRPDPPKREPVLTISPAPAESTKPANINAITPQELKPEPSQQIRGWDNLDLFGQAIEASEDYGSVAIFNDYTPRRNHSFDDSEDDFTMTTKPEVCLAF
jgi:hypothetical protein